MEEDDGEPASLFLPRHSAGGRPPFTRSASLPSQHPLLLVGPSHNPHLLVTRRPLPPRRSLPLYDGGAESGEHVSMDDFSVFPPDLHEGLHVDAGSKPDDHADPAVRPVELGSEVEKEPEEEEVVERVGLGFGLCLRRRVEGVARRIWGAGVAALCRGGEEVGRVAQGGEGGVKLGLGFEGVGAEFWVAAAAAVTVTIAGLVYARRRDRRERDLLLMLLCEKDQRIAQLLHQLALMNNPKVATIVDAVAKKV